MNRRIMGVCGYSRKILGLDKVQGRNFIQGLGGTMGSRSRTVSVGKS